jgi:hypothetical protein
MEIKPLLWPPTLGGETPLVEALEAVPYVCRQTVIRAPAITMVQNEVRINLPTVRLCYCRYARKAIERPETRTNESLLIPLSEIIVIKREVPHIIL